MIQRLKALYAHDTELLELGLGLITCGWGATVVTNPAFFATPGYRLAALIASQSTWAVVAMILGAVQIAAMFMEARRLRITVAAVSALAWIVIAISVSRQTVAGGLPPGTTVYFLIGLLHALFIGVRLWRLP